MTEKLENASGIEQIISISITPLPAFYLKTVKNKTAYDDSVIERISKNKFDVTFKMELHANNYCRAKIWSYKDRKLDDYSEIEEADGNYLNPLMFYEFCFSDLYSDDEKKAIEGSPVLMESLACSFLFRTNELIVHLNRGRYDEVGSLITREISLDSILFRLNVTDFKNLEKFHTKSFSPADRDYYSPSQRYRKFNDHKHHLWWLLEIVDFTEKIFPPIKDSGSVPDSENGNTVNNEKVLRYAIDEIKDISSLPVRTNREKFFEGYTRILALEKLLDENGLDKGPIKSLKSSLAGGYVAVLFGIGTDHISKKEWLAATVKHLEVKDFILGNASVLGLEHDSLINFMAKFETDLKKSENVPNLKTIRESYNIEARKLFGEGQGAVMGFLVDASITPLLVDHGIFSK